MVILLVAIIEFEIVHVCESDNLYNNISQYYRWKKKKNKKKKLHPHNLVILIRELIAFILVLIIIPAIIIGILFFKLWQLSLDGGWGGYVEIILLTTLQTIHLLIVLDSTSLETRIICHVFWWQKSKNSYCSCASISTLCTIDQLRWCCLILKADNLIAVTLRLRWVLVSFIGSSIMNTT